jgi:hypothetical protein
MKRFSPISAVVLLLPALAGAQSAVWTPSCAGGQVSGVVGGATVVYSGPLNGVYSPDAPCRVAGTTVGYDNPGTDFFNSYAYRPNGASVVTNGSFIQMATIYENGQWLGASSLTFSQAVIDPWIAIVSAGHNQGAGSPVRYVFQNEFSVVTHNQTNAAYWGTGTFSSSQVGSVSGLQWFIPGGHDGEYQWMLTGFEFSGIVQFRGTFDRLDFLVLDNENWHGFTVGATPVPVPVPVPEPASLSLLGIGLAGLGAVAGRRRQHR